MDENKEKREKEETRLKKKDVRLLLLFLPTFFLLCLLFHIQWPSNINGIELGHGLDDRGFESL